MFEYLNYLTNKEELINKTKKIYLYFKELENLDINVSDSLKKMETVINKIENDTLSIVLIGAFSDGKTSVIAGWLNEKVNNMNINSDESTNEIISYEPKTLPKGCKIIDTPGLFGDRIENNEYGESVKLSDKTKKYINESDIILYVVSSENPIKDSHKTTIKWVLNDLNKLASTIFVINKMDKIADLTDENEFNSLAKIKIDNLKNKLNECELNTSQIANTKVVCISAKPDGDDDDIDNWKNYRDEYIKRSHIFSLENATTEIIKNAWKELNIKTGCDILNNEINKFIEEINFQINNIEEIIIPKEKDSYKLNNDNLEKHKNRIMQKRNDIYNELKSLNKNKISSIRASSIDNYKDVLEDEIGIIPSKEFYILIDEINSILNKNSELFFSWSTDLIKSFQIERDKQNKLIENITKAGKNIVSQGAKEAGKLNVNLYKQAIFTGRDILKDIGITIKFKPWDVSKFASFTSKAIPILGGALDVISNIFENISASNRQQKFEEEKEKIKNAINEIFIECQEKIKNDTWYFENFSPETIALSKQVEENFNDIKRIEERKDKLLLVMKEIKNIT